MLRYSPETLLEALGDNYGLIKATTEEHHTPDGAIQRFQYGLFEWR